MARVLVVGCGGRGQALARDLVAAGYAVRGTSRDPRRFPDIEAAGAEPAIADPDRIATIMPCLEAVTIVCWLMRGADNPELDGGRLRMLCERLVDTPVRGLVYERAGDEGEAIVRDAAERWNIPVAVLATDPASCAEWSAEAAAAVESLLGRG